MFRPKLATLVTLSTISFSSLIANNDCNATIEPPSDTLLGAFGNGTFKALLRYGVQHRDSNYHVLQDAPTHTVNNKIQAYSALGGYLGYETASLYGFSLGATLYASNPIGDNPSDKKGLGGLYEANGLQESYSVLGEAFLKYEDSYNLIKVGWQELPAYRFISLSDVRMTPFTHEGAIYENSLIDGLKLNLAYITGQKDRSGIIFQDMVRSARVKTGCGGVDASGQCNNGNKMTIRGDFDTSNYDVNGNYVGDDKAMPLVGALYAQDSWRAEAWDYYVNDFVNTLYLYGQYDLNLDEDWRLRIAGQYANQGDVGSSVAGSVDSWFYGLKAEASSAKGMLFFASYNEVDYNENSYDGGTLFVRWGTPQMFNSFQVQDSELAGTKSIGVGAQFDLGTLGIVESTVVRFRYAYYDMPDDLYMRDARQDRSESTFDLRYSFTKNSGFGIFTKMEGLSILLRVAYDDFKTDYNFEEYRKIHGYSFSSVTDDFIDARIYLDCRF